MNISNAFFLLFVVALWCLGTGLGQGTIESPSVVRVGLFVSAVCFAVVVHP